MQKNTLGQQKTYILTNNLNASWKEELRSLLFPNSY